MRRATVRFSPKIDHRFDGIPQVVVTEDQARRASIVKSDPSSPGIIKQTFDARVISSRWEQFHAHG